MPTMLLRVSAVILLAGNCLGQLGSRTAADYKLYVLHNSYADEQWCAYRDLSTFKTEIETRRSPEVGTLAFTGGTLATVNLNSQGEGGDWRVDETYQLDGRDRLIALSRTISLRDGDAQEAWLIKNGKAVKQPSTRPAPNLEFVPDLPVVTDVKAFPFWPLVRTTSRRFRSAGMACLYREGRTTQTDRLQHLPLHDQEGRWCAFMSRTQWKVRRLKHEALWKADPGFADEEPCHGGPGLTRIARKVGQLEDIYGLDSRGSIRTVGTNGFGDRIPAPSHGRSRTVRL